MNHEDIKLVRTINRKLITFSKKIPLPGIDSHVQRECFLEQIIDSIRRIRYIKLINHKAISPLTADTNNDAFDPIKAASWYKRNGNIDEACWLIFLFVHFGKNPKTKWQLIRSIYGGLGNSALWTWNLTSQNPILFCQWLNTNNTALKSVGGFGNHRKYESLNAFKANGTGAAVRSYIDWIGPSHDHQALFNLALSQLGSNPRVIFDWLYNSMDRVSRFGRTAKFDYLTMLGKLELIDIEPGSTYLKGATGPLRGAQLLFGGSKSADISQSTIESLIFNLEAHLKLYYGMQVLEDALCNWQKSPTNYQHFSG
jgi:hypothetical protein